MRFSVQLPTEQVERQQEFLTGPAISQMARAVEDAGFDACFVTDHPFPPDRWLSAGGHHALDPFVALSLAAAATTRLRLQTHVLVLGYRNPFLMAKAAASLDVLSGGRLILGVAAGYLKGEFAALGGDFEQRNQRADEALVALKAAWTQNGVSLEGSDFRARGNTMLPRPLQKPHPPVWIGGNSRRAIRRAATLGDGWLPFPTQPGAASHLKTAALEKPAQLKERISYLKEQAAAAGRTEPLDVCFMPFGMDMFSKAPLDPAHMLDTVAELADIGVTWLSIWLAADTRAEYCDRIAAFGTNIIARNVPLVQRRLEY